MTLFEKGMLALLVAGIMIVVLSVWYITTKIIEKRYEKRNKKGNNND